MKTAMQELIDELSFIEGLKDEIDLSQKSILKTVTIKNALEKEKEQIMFDYKEGVNRGILYCNGEVFISKEEYYNRTYNQKQHIIDIMKADEEDGLYNQNK
jgi:hypothetical protein